MTTLFVVFALIVANVAYMISDACQTESARQMNDFYRVENKKSFTRSWNY